MVLQAAYGLGIPESPTIEISHEGLKSILNRIEAELHTSEVYNRALVGLQTMLGSSAGNAQILIKAVGREAIRLAFQQFAKQYKVIPVNSEADNHQEQQVSGQSSEVSTHTIDTPLQHPVDSEPQIIENRQQMMDKQPLATSAILVDAARQSSSKTTSVSIAKSKKTTKAELAAQMTAQAREECLRQIGQEIRKARLSRSLTVRQLHNQTFVQPHHIQALENGCITQLPEDIYIRGFIRRIGQALGLDGNAMAASLPALDPVKAVLPSWYRPVTASGLYLSSVHLYLGYATLVAGAVGGLAWMSNQSTSTAAVEPEPLIPASESISQSNRVVQPVTQPGVKATETGIKAGADIAPPEAINNN